jgi:hypothetical protein
MQNRSFHFNKFNFRMLILISVILGFTGIFLEILVHIPWVVSNLPPPSPGIAYAFPEVGLKFKRYYKLGEVNCLFFGSSMVDVGLNPEILEQRLNQKNSKQITCMNFGLSAAMVESSSLISQTLVNWQSTNLVILGVSPIEFDESQKVPRLMTNPPVFHYVETFSNNGWLFNTFRLPWFYSGLLNRKDKGFIKDEQRYDSLINSRGQRVTSSKKEIDSTNEEFRLHDFHINQVDYDSLEMFLNNLRSKGIKTIVVEMPVKPSYFPMLVEGGGTMYEIRFVKPIQALLQKFNISLIRTQPKIGDLLNENLWIDENHMCFKGSKIFTNYLADQILLLGN